MPDQAMLDNSLAWLDSVIAVDSSADTHSAQDTVQLDFFNLDGPAPSQSSASPPAVQNPPLHASTSSSPEPTSNIPGPSSNAAPASNPRPPKPPRRRIRPKIALDPNQPLTARGKPRARVYVACNQCRVRKTRCDGAKPICFNCCKRPPEDGESCSYEAQPKRRGQDKTPGLRVRSSNSERPSKRKRTNDGSGHDSDSSEDDDEEDTHQLQPSYDSFPGLSSDESEYDPFPLVDLDSPTSNVEFYIPPVRRDASPAIPARPSLQFARDTWWDALLTFYSTEDGLTESGIVPLTGDQRTATVLHVVADLRALFTSSIWWLSFIHLPRFWDSILTPSRRVSVQPSVVLSALAIGVFIQSSEVERGAGGRTKALKLIDLAHSSLQASLASGWVDYGLVQAAWLMVYFELQTHPMQSLERNRSSLLLLDSLIRLFSLTTLDVDIKSAHHSQRLPISADPAFVTPPQTPPESPPNLPPEVPLSRAAIEHYQASIARAPTCNCNALCLEHSWPSVRAVAPSWAATPMWPESLSEAEFRKEECRRLVWASLMVTASMNSYVSVIEGIEKANLYIKNPDNYALLLPGESLAIAGAPVPASNLWALYLRTMMLLHKCVGMRIDPAVSDADHANFALYAWIEIDATERALDGHTCLLERNLGFQAREMLFSARMCISHEFQRFIPQITTHGNRLFYRDKAERWLRQRMMMAERLWQNLISGIDAPALDHRRPMLIYWHMSHVMKALAMWKTDNTLLIALEAAKMFSRRTEYMMQYWPSSQQRHSWQTLRFQLVEACLKVGIAPPDPSLPGTIAQLRSQLAASRAASASSQDPQAPQAPLLPHLHPQQC